MCVFENRVLRIFGQSREDGDFYMSMSSMIYRPAVHVVRLECSRRMNLEEQGVLLKNTQMYAEFRKEYRRKLVPSIIGHRRLEITKIVLNT